MGKQEGWRAHLWSMRWGILGIVCAGIVGVTVTVIANYYGVRDEIKNYQIEGWKVTHCPIPFGLVDEVGLVGSPPGDRVGVVWRQARWLNKNVAPQLGFGREVYVKAGDQPPKNAVITVRLSKPSERTYRSRCWIPGLRERTPPPGGLSLGFFHFRVREADRRLVNSDVVMCRVKYEKMKGVIQKPPWLNLHDWGRYVRHEMMHPLMGSGHPDWSVDLTHAGALQPYVSKGTIRILRRLYGPVCGGGI
jgi:hypothetical protein